MPVGSHPSRLLLASHCNYTTNFPRHKIIPRVKMAIQSVVLKTIYVGTFIHSVSLAELQVLKRSAVAVDESGKILLVEHPVEASMLEMWAKEAGTTIVEAGPGQFFFPGLIGMMQLFFPGQLVER